MWGEVSQKQRSSSESEDDIEDSALTHSEQRTVWIQIPVSSFFSLLNASRLKTVRSNFPGFQISSKDSELEG